LSLRHCRQCCIAYSSVCSRCLPKHRLRSRSPTVSLTTILPAAPGSALDRFGASLLGYDAYSGEDLPFPDGVTQTTPDWHDLTRTHPPGVALLPGDRAKEGIIGAMTVGENLTLSALGRFGSAARLDRRREAGAARSWIGKLSIRSGGPASPITTLSGGNQQKVLFGRVLAIEPDVLVMCEPTAGVDIGARHAIYDLVAEQVQAGLSVVVASSDVGDLQALCTRVLVLHGGTITRELTGDAITEFELLHAMEGLESESAP